MSNLGLFKLVTTPDGTVVKEVDSRGTQTGRQLWSFKWDSRDQTSSTACPRWIYRIVVGDTKEGAKAAVNLIADDNSLVSSSRSSRDLQVIHVDKDGHLVDFFQVPYALVPKINDPATPRDFPQAVEMWFCQQPFDPSTGVQDLEKQCKTQKPGS
jgi:hypothetical protein